MIDDICSLMSGLFEYYEIGKDNFHVCRVGLVNFYIPQVYQFLEVVSWLDL